MALHDVTMTLHSHLEENAKGGETY